MINPPILDYIHALKGLAQDDLAQLENIFSTHIFKAGDYLFRQGEMGDKLFALTSGSVEVLIQIENDGVLGEPSRIGTFGPGQITGELCCFDPAPRVTTMRAVEASETRILSRENLDALSQENPALWSHLVAILSKNIASRIRSMNEQIAMREQKQGIENSAIEVRGQAVPPHTVDMARLASARGLEAGDLDLFRSVARLTRYEAGQHLCVEGKPGKSCFFLAEGEVDVYRLYQQGPQKLATLEPGSIVGQMALVDSFPRSASVVAKTTVVAVELDQGIFQRLMATGSDFSRRFQTDLAMATVRQFRLATNRLVGTLGSGDMSGESLNYVAFPEGDTADRFVDSLAKSWNVSLGEIDDIEILRPSGQVTAAEIKERGRS